MKVIWSPLALQRASDVVDYISQDSPRAAGKWVTAIFRKVHRLSRFPKSGRPLRETHRPDLREIRHGSYRIIYRLRATQIEILTLRHSKQLFPHRDLTLSPQL